MRHLLAAILWVAALAGTLVAQRGYERYALVLEEAPLAAQVSSRKDLRAIAPDVPARIEAAQNRLREELARRGIRVTGSVKTLLNAVFVRASEEQAAELRGLPGVRRVAWLPPMKRHLDEAIKLVGVPQAWNVIGGAGNAGAGVKIGIIDTGIDQEHPAFQDPSLQPPSGFPKCQPADCAYTNSKVIVARSYVDMLVWGDKPASSRPDDLSPRDRVGHGTGVAMIAAGVRNQGPSATITGVAPKAWLGNYKVFGSPGVNDWTYGDVVIEALSDAFDDGMDIVELSLGWSAMYGPFDAGATCGETGGNACDALAQAVDNTVKLGMAVVVSVGNDGDLGNLFPTLNSLNTPGTAPSAITVGASTNAHIWFSSVRVAGSDVPSNLRSIPARFGDGPKPAGPLTAPARDVTRLEDNGRACSPLATGTLSGAVALIQRGDCAFATKVNNAQKAGAVGVIIYQVDGSDDIFAPAALAETGIPAVLIGNTDGRNLKSFLSSNPDRAVTLDPGLSALRAEFDTVADFSSRGPSIGNSYIKPDLVAVGTDLYTATQRYDPNGDMYSADGYTAVQGTSFAVPMVAGAAALVKQRNSGFSAAQLKSAVVNTASQEVRDQGATARVTAVGAGKLNAESAVRTNVTVDPATLSFGVVTQGGLPMSKTLKINNSSNSTLNLAVAQRDADAKLSLTVIPNSVAAGATSTVSVRLDGTLPPPGAFEGAITVKGGAVDLRVPYLYLLGDGAAYNIFPIMGFDFVGNVSELIPGRLIGFKLIDRYGVPVRNSPVRFRVTLGGGSIDSADAQTDIYGIAAAKVYLGSQLGEQEFTAEAGGLTVHFPGRARLRPTIETNGVVNAASFERGKAVAPGSYIAIFGRGLSETTRVFSTPYLPLSLAGVSVSFDVPSKGLSLPGRLHFVSDGQVNVQAPWELQGLNAAQMKVSIGDSSSSLYTVPLADYSPAFFEYTEPSSGRLLVAALDENYALVGTGNALGRGRVAQLYVNGLGPVDNQPPTGEIAPAQPLARTRTTPTVTVGGRPATVLFSGLAPYNVGLYQVNITVPSDAPSGIQSVAITAGGVTSKAGNLPIQ
jgi:minor extracellular serine protease Vpr